MKTLSRRVISIFLCLSLLVNSFLPLVVYAQDFDPGGGGSYEEGSSDGGSYDYADSASTAETAPVEEPQEDASSFTPSGITPEFVDGSTPPQPTPAPVVEESDFTPPSGINPEFVDDSTPSEPAPDEVITDSTSQDRAFAEYASRAEAMDQYQDEVYANSRADESISGNTIIYLPSQITGMVQNQLDRVEEEINKIAENTTPMTREEVLQAQRLERKEEQLNKIAQQQDAALEAAEEEKRKQLELAMNLTPEDREVYLKETGIVPADTPSEETIDTLNKNISTGGLQFQGADITNWTLTLKPECRRIPLPRECQINPLTGQPLKSSNELIQYLSKDPSQRAQDLVRKIAAGQTLTPLEETEANILSLGMYSNYDLGKRAYDSLTKDAEKANQLRQQAGWEGMLPPQTTKDSLANLSDEEFRVLLEQAANGQIPEIKRGDLLVQVSLDIYGLARTDADRLKAQREYALFEKEALAKAQQNSQEIAVNIALGLVGAGEARALGGVARKEIATGVKRAIQETTEEIYVTDQLIDSFIVRQIEQAEAPRLAQADMLRDSLFGGRLLDDVPGLMTPDIVEGEREIINYWLASGYTPADIKEKLRLADNFIRSPSMFDDPLQYNKIANAVRYDSVLPPPATPIASTGNNGQYASLGRSGQLRIMDALFSHEKNVEQLDPSIQQAKRLSAALREYAIKNGADPNSFAPLEKVFDPDRFHISEPPSRNDWAGLYVSSDDSIVIAPASVCQGTVCGHEVGHAERTLALRQQVVSSDPIYRQRRQALTTVAGGELSPALQTQLELDGLNRIETNLAEKIKGESGAVVSGVNYLKYDEGLNEWVNRLSYRLTGETQEYTAYQPQVRAFDEIEQRLTEVTRDRGMARAAMIEAGRGRRDDRIFELLGYGNAEKGAAEVTRILDKVPSVDSKAVSNRPWMLTKNDLKIAITAVSAELGLVAGQDTVKTPSPTPKVSPLLPFRIISPIYAAESTENAVMVKGDSFEVLVKEKLAEQVLKKYGFIDTNLVKEVLNIDVLQPEFLKISHGYLLTTGKAGTVEGSLEKNRYLVDISSMPNIDIKTPALVDLSVGDATLGIAIKEGTGKVETLGYVGKEAKGIVSKAYAQESSSAKVKVVVFADNNGNGVIDNEEKALPWAGVSVKLTKVNEENTISLNAGWNLVSLTLLPNQTLTASTLLKEIKSQDGNATTVSTLVDGAWKSYVKRGENDYSMDDFAIEVGKAYFVKALKPSVFKYSGQNLVAPVKLKLNSGWNAVGLPKTSKEYKASTLINDIVKEGSASGTVAWWDSGLWDTFVRQKQEEYGNNFTILPNFGYIIKVEKEGEAVP